ncbi:holo-ACP synthase [Idiomarina sp. UBA3162]|uniref:holo-ACP synthase n=1 Tax=Idiomarina sp. UBA3162 TaxID=1946641 RepID=UPI000C8F7E02|nr:holo-ACP synthase [Idiomarina sp. UBA3162]MAD54356.1 holo-ACP synthase [Idiomarinaceae bacterium]|tara:strand:- start:112 stop:495 length:384 start_codon:yes stop_codon:yes gene_type:complete
MAIFGMGTDMIAVARVETSLARGNGLVKRVLTEYEQDIWAQHRAPADYLAKRFAAKEACAKAFGTGIAQGLSFQHMEVRNNALGRPEWVFYQQAQQWCERYGIVHAHLSISDDSGFAIATVILETSS